MSDLVLQVAIHRARYDLTQALAAHRKKPSPSLHGEVVSCTAALHALTIIGHTPDIAYEWRGSHLYPADLRTHFHAQTETSGSDVIEITACKRVGVKMSQRLAEVNCDICLGRV